MGWIEQAVATFGHLIGIGDLALDPGGNLQLELEGGLCLSMHYLHEAMPEPVFVLAATMPMARISALQRYTVLRECHAATAASWPIQAGATHDALLLAIRLDQRAITAPVIDQSLRLLMQQHERLAHLVGDATR
jgi:type III secretion system chaperone SycN